MISNNLKILLPYLDSLKNISGNINITLNNFSLILNNKSLIGDSLESWIGEYLKSLEKVTQVKVTTNPISQTFPDLYLETTLYGKTNLEIKTFDIEAGANFDIANFNSYIDSLLENPNKINADYLIIGYSLNNGHLKIKNIWYKKVWQLCCPSKNWALKLQIKRNIIYNIRPCNLIGKSIYQPFSSKYEFITALQNVLDQYSQTKFKYTNWKSLFLEKLNQI